ncbi:WXG100 family type VII secretion target [Kitasatospora azatica]|uniref:WXG100 family type VII secretion target n=1 Tax=Kitasatospora azatica TaxID=58347 RepID=UPI00056D2403|nr:WXG100 family type VII secretion target [Kitasatospora azatica]
MTARAVTDGGGGGPIAITPADLQQAALAFAGGQDKLDAACSALNSVLQNSAGMAGDDKWGTGFAKSYDPAATKLFDTMSAAVRALGQASTALVGTANNYLKADHHSNALPSALGPDTYQPPAVYADIVYPAPPTCVGPGSNDWPPPLDSHWPDGHQDQLRTAAGAYRTAAGALDDLAGSLQLTVQGLTDTNTSESVDAMGRFWGHVWKDGDPGGGAPLSTAKLACTVLAKACDDYANAIDKAHSEFENQLAEAGIAIGVTTALGVLGTVFTLGMSDGAAAGLDAAEAAAIVGGADALADAALTDIAAEGVATLDTELTTAAESVPELATADAETADVETTLDKELTDAETRAEDPAADPAQLTLAEKSQAVREILTDSDGNLIGEESATGVRMVTQEQVDQVKQELYDRLGPPETRTLPKGNLENWQLSGDPKVTISFRDFSDSGGDTIDFNNVPDLPVKRLHIPQS